MTTPLPHPQIARRDLSALTAGIPHMMGFPPTESLVLFTFTEAPVLTMATTMRADLPAPHHVDGLVEHVVAAAVHNEAVAMIAVVVGGSPARHRPLVDALARALEDNDILLVHASWVNRVAEGERWRCYADARCTGEIPDPQASTWAAARAVAGRSVFRDRADMAAQLAPDPPESLARREQLLDACLRDPQTPYTADDLDADQDLMTQMLTVAAASPEPPALDDRQLVRLARALSHSEVRDECMAAALSPDPDGAERLWTVLVRALPAPERAEPATLLAMSAYLRGEGVLAAMALRTGLDANPAHATALLLHAALAHPVPPDELRALLVKSILKNDGVLDDDELPEETPEGEAGEGEVPGGGGAEQAVPERDDEPPWDSTAASPAPMNARTAATLGLLARERTTANPLTAYLPTWPT